MQKKKKSLCDHSRIVGPLDGSIIVKVDLKLYELWKEHKKFI